MLGNPGFTAYGTGKAGVFGFTNSLASEAAGTAVTVNCILPSAWTRMTAELPDPVLRDVFEQHFQAEHVASFVARLAHPSCNFNGEAFEVRGRVGFACAASVRPSSRHHRIGAGDLG